MERRGLVGARCGAALTLLWSSAGFAEGPPPIATPFQGGAPPDAASRSLVRAAAVEGVEIFTLERRPELLRDVGLGNVDLNEHTIAQAFYAVHPDRFDHLVVFTDFPVALAGNRETAALYVPVSSAVTGINVGQSGRFEEVFDFSMNYGSSGALRGVILLGNAAVMPLDPADRRYNNGASPLNLMGQETLHEFGAFVTYRDAAGVQKDLLGRAQAHWSYFVDSGGSDLEGNVWLPGDAADLFVSGSFGGSFSQTDQYLMGLRLPSEVTEPLRVLREPQGVEPAEVSAQSAPRAGATARGTLTPIPIDQIIDAHGPRLPSAAASPRLKRQAFILLTDPEGQRRQDALARLEALRRAWPGYYYAAADERGRLVATLDGADELLRFGFAAGPEGFEVEGAAFAAAAASPGLHVQAAGAVVRLRRDALRVPLERVSFVRVDVGAAGLAAPCGAAATLLLDTGDPDGPAALPFAFAADGHPHAYTLPVPADLRAETLRGLAVEIEASPGAVLTLARVEGLDVPTLRDADGDGVLDEVDRCPEDPDPLQGDADGDGVGDACDDAPVAACAPPAPQDPSCAAAHHPPRRAAPLLAGALGAALAAWGLRRRLRGGRTP